MDGRYVEEKPKEIFTTWRFIKITGGVQLLILLCMVDVKTWTFFGTALCVTLVVVTLFDIGRDAVAEIRRVRQ